MATRIVDLGSVVGPPGADGAPGTAGAAGKNAYQYAVEGGYTGTEAEFKALMAAAASTKYVDDAISEATKKLITLRIRPDSGSVGQEINIACSRLTGAMYAVEYSGAFTTNGNGKAEIIVSPPYGYAINMLNDSESLLIEYYDSSWHSKPEVQCTAKDDGSVSFSISGLQSYETCNFSFVRMDRTKIPYITMEVA